MTLFIIAISAVLGILVAASFLISWYNRRNVTSMSGMMGAMVIGMGVGLTIGVLLGVLYRDNLFLSTILSMFIGMGAGILTGIPKGPLAIIDGLLAGVMGGMMGAMLGVMVSGAEGILLVKILLIITVCSSFFILVFLLRNSRNETQVTPRWLIKPILTFCCFLFIFIGIGYIDVKNDTGTSSHNHGDHGNNQRAGEDSSTSENITTDILKITTPGLSYQPAKIHIAKAQPIELQLINHDSVEHDFEVREFAYEILQAPVHNHGGSHGHSDSSNTATLHVHAQPHSTSSVSFIPLKEGIYEFFCTIPGHKEAGMTGTLIIN
ncbi:cupredoxin domain-containing protein [Evansella halocellulosilytica]|uniref:cupredoxin domain-containing protein n=1 Tax=Evansella halocellulosilytica TaxID=2011013 RepID=UPI0015C6A0A4|nr:cupredoxin domain-containing protein [Evansella halocellulosilytica]